MLVKDDVQKMIIMYQIQNSSTKKVFSKREGKFLRLLIETECFKKT
jgi:hypothetical protein